jgi:hypothetical protein
MKELCILARLRSYENETPVRDAWRGVMVPRAGLSFLLSHDALRTNERANPRVCVMNLLRSGSLICGNSRRPRQYSRGLIDTRRSRSMGFSAPLCQAALREGVCKSAIRLLKTASEMRLT